MTQYFVFHSDYLFSCKLPVTCFWPGYMWLRWTRAKVTGDIYFMPDRLAIPIQQPEEDEPPF